MYVDALEAIVFEFLAQQLEYQSKRARRRLTGKVLGGVSGRYDTRLIRLSDALREAGGLLNVLETLANGMDGRFVGISIVAYKY